MRDFLDALHGFGGDGFAMALKGPIQQLEVDLQHGQLLADVVVQLPRDPRTLLFLRAQQLGPEVADPFVTRAQSCLTSRSCCSASRRLALWMSSPAINAACANRAVTAPRM